MDSWQMQQAKARLAELVRQAETEGPQDITVHGRSVAVMLSRTEFDRLAGSGESLVDFMRRSPLYGLDVLTLERDKSPVRRTRL